MTLTQVTKAGLDEIALDHVFTIGASGTSAYTFQGEGLNGTVNNPTLYLTRGKTYRFENGSGGHPLRIQSTTGMSGTAYNTGVTGNNTTGTVIVEVQHDAPDVLYYQCTSHTAMNGILYITGALADGGVTTAKIADDAVNNDKLANSIVAEIAANTAKTSNATHTGEVTGDTALTIANAAVTTIKLADEAVTLAKLPHGTSSNDGKFLRANNGADPTFETVDFTNLNASNLTSGTIPDARFPSTLPAISGANLTGIATATTAINTQSSAYTLVASDAGKAVHVSSTVTVPNSVFSAGEQVTLINNTGSNQNLITASGLTIYNTSDDTTPTGNNILFPRAVGRLFFITGSIAYLEGASSVPTFTASNLSSNIVLATVFGSSDWASVKPKIYNVPSGVTVYGTVGGASAILVSSGMGGILTVNVSGTVIGKGGTGGNGGAGAIQNISNAGAGGTAGGHAIQVDSANVTIHNNSGGQISGGGGGGGGGGAGGWRQVGFSQYRGGNGGNGGNGAGYNQSQSNGTSGENFNQYSGNGGNGGNGGALGSAGSNGTAGEAVYQHGSGGYAGSGGSAGKAIWSNNGNSWTNGTTSGTYHGSYT